MSIKVYAEHYYNDNRTTDHVLRFQNLEGDFITWVDEHYNGTSVGVVPYYQSKHYGEQISRIDLGTMSDGGCWWIHEIDSSLGIEFTDGSRTNGKKHASKRVRAVLDSFWDEKSNPESRFVD